MEVRTHHAAAGLTEFPDVGQPADTVTDQEDGGDDETDLGVPYLSLSHSAPLAIRDPGKQQQHYCTE